MEAEREGAGLLLRGPGCALASLAMAEATGTVKLPTGKMMVCDLVRRCVPSLQ
ncbi:unnamed protein product [Caretta caretta]